MGNCFPIYWFRTWRNVEAKTMIKFSKQLDINHTNTVDARASVKQCIDLYQLKLNELSQQMRVHQSRFEHAQMTYQSMMSNGQQNSVDCTVAKSNLYTLYLKGQTRRNQFDQLTLRMNFLLRKEMVVENAEIDELDAKVNLEVHEILRKSNMNQEKMNKIKEQLAKMDSDWSAQEASNKINREVDKRMGDNISACEDADFEAMLSSWQGNSGNGMHTRVDVQLLTNIQNSLTVDNLHASGAQKVNDEDAIEIDSLALDIEPASVYS